MPFLLFFSNHLFNKDLIIKHDNKIANDKQILETHLTNNVSFATKVRGKIMKIEDLDIGDVVYAKQTIIDDGSMPNGVAGDILAEAGTRGVITMIGYVEEEPKRSVFLVRFEDKDLNLGNPIGCWIEDLAVAPALLN